MKITPPSPNYCQPPILQILYKNPGISIHYDPLFYNHSSKCRPAFIHPPPPYNLEFESTQSPFMSDGHFYLLTLLRYILNKTTIVLTFSFYSFYQPESPPKSPLMLDGHFHLKKADLQLANFSHTNDTWMFSSKFHLKRMIFAETATRGVL